MSTEGNKSKFAFTRHKVWQQLDTQGQKSAMEFCEGYKHFLDQAKTERECAQQVVIRAQARGFRLLDEYNKLNPGDRVVVDYRNKAVLLAVIGEKPLEGGVNVVGAHMDSPRLDLKPQPLYEEEDLSLFKTHYYGGIKKYQWLTIPLALHGIICKTNGDRLDIRIGEAPGDPIFTITDLLPHLSKDQMEKKLKEAIEGEQLNILIGSFPVAASDVEHPVKTAILNYLNQFYGIAEEDFISAELEVVPAWGARDIGFDRSMIGAYGHDDRVCVYTGMEAVLSCTRPGRTAVGLFVDKEEIGSSGNTGMAGRFFENAMAEIMARVHPQFSELALRRLLANSRALSADVNAGLDPNFERVMEKNNAARIGGGPVLTKYTGSKGKSQANDAHAEYLADIRGILNRYGITWQTGELGKVDQGGGGTIAYLMAVYGMDVLDCGVALLSMHAPLEVASKADIYEAYRCYQVFLMS